MQRSPFEPFLLENGFVILDGGLATELETQVKMQQSVTAVRGSQRLLSVFMSEHFGHISTSTQEARMQCVAPEGVVQDGGTSTLP